MQGGHAENTVASCLAAASAGLSWIEIDVGRTADDELVLRHDPVAPDGSYLVDRTAAELRKQDVERLTDLLAVLPPHVGLDIDVKTVLPDATDPAGRRTSALLAKALTPELAAVDRTLPRPLLISSFDPGLLVQVRDLLPEADLGLLTYLGFPLQQAVPAAAGLGMDVLCVHTGSFGPPGEAPYPPGGERPPIPSAWEAITAAHQAGLEVLVWCPDPATAVRYADAGADAVCVDDVPGTVAALRG
jgi:glycerophosphoryl diester phosphodiesterase